MASNTLRPIEKYPLDREFVYFAKTLTENHTLKWVCLGLGLVVLVLGLQINRMAQSALAVKPLVVRVNSVGRAEAVDYKNFNYTPQDAEIRFFLTKFVTGFFSMNHRMSIRDYPESMYYLSPARLSEVQERNRKSNWYGKFMNSADDNADVEVANIGLDMTSVPYRAHVEYTRVFTNSAGVETKRENWTCSLAFVVDYSLAQRDPKYVKTNPLGFQITDFRPELAFK